jgi:hypothetical protein
MLLQEYQIQYNEKPAGGLEVYCKVEGVDPLYMRSIAKIEKKGPKKTGNAAAKFFREWMERMKLFGRLHPWY